MNGICLTETLFHAAIEGLKTQARWIMKPQPTHGLVVIITCLTT